MERFGLPTGIVFFKGLHFAAQPVELTAHLSNFHGAEQGCQDETEEENKDKYQKKGHWRRLIAEKNNLHRLRIIDAEDEEHQQDNEGKKDAKGFHGRLSSKDRKRSA